MMKYQFCEIEFGSPEYDESIALRHSVLRKPLGLEFDEADLAKEYDSFHLALFDENSNMVACLILKTLTENSVKMRQVAVDATQQSKGIGSHLVTFAEQFAIGKGYTKMELNARDTACNFYKNLNYQIEGDMFTEVGIPHFYMWKKLSKVLIAITYPSF